MKDGLIEPVLIAGHRAAVTAQNVSEFIRVALLRRVKLFQILRRRLIDPDRGDNDKNNAEYCEGVYEKFVALHPGPSVLELGPGPNLGVSALFAARGYRAVAIDVVDSRSNSLNSLYDELIGRSGRESTPGHVHYVLGDAHGLPFATESFDFVFSNATFEHLRAPGRVVREVFRILKPGGVTAHQIDMRDHRHFDNPLRFLRYPPRIWSLMNWSVEQGQNRWRISHYRQAFESRGFEVSFDNVSLADEQQLAELRWAAREYRDLSPEDASTMSGLLIAVKPRPATAV